MDIAEGLSRLVAAADLIDLADLEADHPAFLVVWEARSVLREVQVQVESLRG